MHLCIYKYIVEISCSDVCMYCKHMHVCTLCIWLYLFLIDPAANFGLVAGVKSCQARYITSYIHTYITYIQKNIHHIHYTWYNQKYIAHVFMRTHLHTCMHAYARPYIHKYIHTLRCAGRVWKSLQSATGSSPRGCSLLRESTFTTPTYIH